MRYKVILSFFLSLLILSTAKGQIHTIPAKQAVEKFYRTYDLSAFDYPKVEFEKKLGNWYVKKIFFENNTVVYGKPTLFFDASLHDFVKLGWNLNDDTTELVDVREYMDQFTSYNFDLQPSYGFPGWYNDVINYYTIQIAKLADDELFALGRAYSSKASSPLTNQVNDILPSENYLLPLKANALSEEQLHAFITAQDSAILLFSKLAAQNKEYTTMVGTIGQKLANEQMVKFQLLLTFTDSAWRDCKLGYVIYDTEVLEASRNLLNACPANSIFVAFGDNDFYPLLYLQQQESLRRDVYVISYNLIGLDKFIFRATMPQFDAGGIKLSIDTVTYKGENNSVVYTSYASGVLDLPDFLAQLQTHSPTDNPVIIKAGSIKILRGNTLSALNVSLSSTNYFFKNHWVLMDIISKAEDRAICVPDEFYDQLDVINENLVKSGDIYIIK